jgi:RHS repeat-associated protein
VKNQSGALKYQYTLTDHLGNVRATSADNGAGAATVIEESHYYAFGMRIEGLSTSNPDNKFTYNGKELEDDHGLNWYHYGARFYDAQIGRWHVADPIDEYSSPYAFVGNRPTIAIDPDGAGTYFVNGAGNDQSARWGYNEKIVNALLSVGIANVKHVPITQGQELDQAYSFFASSKRILEPNSAILAKAVIIDNLAAGEQRNISGYSFGAVVAAQAALLVADAGYQVDNLILIGAPISTESDLYKALSSNANIKNIIRVDIPNDPFSNPESLTPGDGVVGFAKGVMQFMEMGDNIPHFKYARPENDAERAQLADELYEQGVR